MEIYKLEALLNQVKLIAVKWEKVAFERGENFNVFNIIGIKNNEVKMHSAMLKELLDVNGSHGMKEKFLMLFLSEIGKDGFFIDILDTKCRAEIGIGERTEITGGRIDLYIFDSKKNAIIIENKIFAGEQENQLIRYFNYNQNAPIVFLTLLGEQSNTLKFKNENTNIDITDKVICISYKHGIISWLEKCQKESFDKPLLREGIKHYINLLKILTNQTMEKDMSIDIIDTIAKSDNYKGALEIYKSWNILKGETEFNFISKLQQKIRDKGHVVIQEWFNDKNSILHGKAIWRGFGFECFKDEKINLMCCVFNSKYGLDYCISKIENNMRVEFNESEYIEYSKLLNPQKREDIKWRFNVVDIYISNINFEYFSNEETVRLVNEENMDVFVDDLYYQIENYISNMKRILKPDSI